MKKFFLLIFFLLILSCNKNSSYIETLKKVKFDKPIMLTDVSKTGWFLKKDIYLEDIIYDTIAFATFEDFAHGNDKKYVDFEGNYNSEYYISDYLKILESIKNESKWKIDKMTNDKWMATISYNDYIARIIFYTEGNFVSVDLNDLSVESLKSFYTYNYYEDFSVEYKKLDRPSYIVGWYVIDEAKYKEKAKEKTKSETSKNEDESSDEDTEINLEEIYNTKDTSKLSKLNEIELKILQNYPFAKDGYVFETPELKEYFENQSWYEPSTTLSNNEISIKNKDDEWFIYMKKYNNF